MISKHHGFVNQYYGDGIMALYLGEAADAVNAAIELAKEAKAKRIPKTVRIITVMVSPVSD